MAERKAISKKIRMEVLKRDRFTCQYCGRSAPDVVLEIDHIKPVSKGGTNDIMNLVTACIDCNRGKSNIELADDTMLKKQQRQLEEMAKKKEQLEMMLEWRESLNNLDEQAVDAVEDIFKSVTDYGFSETGRRKIKKLFKEFSVNEVLNATEIALDTYYDGSEESWDEAFNKISGICYLKRTQANNPQSYYVNYTVKALKNKGFWYNKYELTVYIQNNVKSSEDFDTLKRVISNSYNWTGFKGMCEDWIGGTFD